MSAGYDSRFILSGLIDKGYINIITYSYGRKNNREAKIAKKIAQFLNIPWFYINYNNFNQRNIMLSKVYEDYKAFSDLTSAVHFPQDFQAILYLKISNLIPNDSIFVNGQTGDFISGNHIITKNKYKSINSILEIYILKHYKIWDSLIKRNKKLILDSLISRISNFSEKNLKNELLLELLQKLEYEDRQAKYVMGGQRVYEFLGYDWRLPLWDFRVYQFLGEGRY